MVSDGPKPTRGKFPAKATLPGMPGGESLAPVRRTAKAKAPVLPEPTPPLAADTIVPAAALAEIAPHVPVSKPEPQAAVPVQAVTPDPVTAVTEPPAITPAPAVSPVATTQEEKTMEATMQEATTKTQAYFGDANDRAKQAMEKGAKLFEEMNAFGKGNVEALVESSRIAAKGLETLGQDAAEYTRKQFESTTAIMKSLASVKSPTELFKLQSDYVRQSFDSMVAESSKTTEAMLKLAGEIAQPLSNRVALAAEKAKIAA